MSILTVAKVEKLVTKFKRIHGNDRVKIIKSLDKAAGPDLRKTDGRLKSSVSRILSEKNIEKESTSGSRKGAILSLETKDKLRSRTKKTLRDKRARIDAGEKLKPGEIDFQTQLYLSKTPKERRALTDKSFQDRRAKIAKELGIPRINLERNPIIAQHMDWMRSDRLLGKNTPIKDLQAVYGKPGVGYEDVMKNKYILQEALSEGGTDSIIELLHSYGISGNQLMSSVGHTIPIRQAIKIKNKVAPWMTDVEFVQMINNPRSINAELNLLNTQKMPSERLLWMKNYGWDKRKLGNLDSIMKDAQVKGKFFTPEGELTSIGMQGHEIDPQKLRWWINKMANEDPFKGGDKLRLLPNKKFFKSVYDLPNYSSGGLVKLLNRLKLTKKQKDLIMKTAYSPHRKPATGPKALREKRIKEKLAKVGATKKWGYVKSDDIKTRKKRINKRPFAAGGIVSFYVR